MFKKNLLTSVASFLTIASIVLGASIAHVELAFAAALTTLSNTQSSLKINTVSDHTIQFVTPTGLIAGQAISITFPSGYATGTFAVANFDLATSTSATCSGFTDAVLVSGAPSALSWGVTQATATVYITSGTAVIPANRCVQVQIGANATSGATGVSQITNPISPGSYAITINAGADSGTITQNIITDDTVVISATVQQSLTFTISTTTIYFGNLGSGAAKFASSTNTSGDTLETIAHTLGIATNAPSGYNMSIRGQTLTSQQNASNTISFIGSAPLPSAAGAEQFGVRATVSGGTGATINATYASTTAFGYDGTATSSSLLASGSGSTNTSTYSLRYVANIAGTTEAGTYVASLIYVATANF